jgi:hypothetical protein
VLAAPANALGDGRAPEGAAMLVDGRINIIRGNLIPAPSDPAIRPWLIGIQFRSNGNFYGDNIVWAIVPFDLGATVQQDLGGNVGFSQ